MGMNLSVSKFWVKKMDRIQNEQTNGYDIGHKFYVFYSNFKYEQ